MPTKARSDNLARTYYRMPVGSKAQATLTDLELGKNLKLTVNHLRIDGDLNLAFIFFRLNCFVI